MKAKIGIKEMVYILIRAIRINIKIRGALSSCISIFGFVMAFTPILISINLKNMTDKVQSLYGTGLSQVNSVLNVFACLAGLYLLQSLFSFAQGYLVGVDTGKVHQYIKERILRCTCDVKFKYIENYDNYKEKIAFADTFAGASVANSMQSVIGWFQKLVTLFSIIIVMFNVNPWIVVLLLITCIPATILSYMQNDQEYKHKTKWMKEGIFVIHYYNDCCAKYTLNDVRFFSLFDYIKNAKWKEMVNKHRTKKNELTKKHVLYNSIADILRNSIYIIILLIISRDIYINPLIGLGSFMLVFTMAGQLQGITTSLFVGAAKFVSDIGYMKDFFDLDDLEFEVQDKRALPYEKTDICFKKVNFTYPNTNTKILHDINVTIRQGEKIAIVGENGSGKTTFINLLCGMHEPDSGEILINNIKIKDDISRTRRTISAVFQDFGMYETSIRENIIISDYAKTVSDDELLQLCKQTGTFDFIKTRENGLDEIVGSFNEKGDNLSGGQWQKIAITRAAYRDSAKIMVLDEPTAALDPIAEAELYHNFSQLTGDRTTILISHRLGITKIVDRILVFANGQIVEDGNHTQLINQNGLYARMYNAQAQWYN